jgi:N-acetylglucosamine-6-phosphate deacetylase
MGEINHRETKTALSALVNDNIYTEIIADGKHLSDEILNLIFRVKPLEKILLISDCLPITASDLKHTIFADEEIFYDGEKATSKSGTLAGSTKLLPEIVKILGQKGLFNSQLIQNSYDYHCISTERFVEIDDKYNVSAVQ